MKNSKLVLIAIAAVCVIVIVSVLSPVVWFLGGSCFEFVSGMKTDIEIDSYRLCQDVNGDDVIIIKYLLKNNGDEPTCLIYEGDFYVYQDGVSLTEFYTDDENKLPKECNYDAEDQYKNIKGGVEYYAEIAYWLEYPDKDVEVEVNDYGLFDKTKEKVFKLK